jgi:hypothetical protein
VFTRKDGEDNVKALAKARRELETEKAARVEAERKVISLIRSAEFPFARCFDSGHSSLSDASRV